MLTDILKWALFANLLPFAFSAALFDLYTNEISLYCVAFVVTVMRTTVGILNQSTRTTVRLAAAFPTATSE